MSHLKGAALLLAVSLLTGCSTQEDVAVQPLFEVEPSKIEMPSSSAELLPYARLYARALAIERGENVVIVSDRSIPSIKNEAFQMAVEEAGANPHLIVLDGYPEVHTPEEMFRYWTNMWWPQWVFSACKSADAVLSLSNVTHNHSYYEGHAIGQWFARNGIREMMVDEGVSLMAHPPLRDYPIEVEDAIRAKVRGQIPSGRSSVRISDLEGTELTMVLINRETSSAHGQGARRPHIAHAVGAWRKGRVRTDGGPILLEEVNGTIVSSSLHVGPLSEALKLTVENSRVTVVEGGGRFGDWVRSMMETHKERDFGYYGVGVDYLEELQLTTHPKVFPVKGQHKFSELDASWRPTWRSGKIHLAFGSGGPIFDEEHNVVEDEFHVDVEIYFSTMIVADKTIVEKGRLLALDDAEVREVAARYGDPDVLLQEDWTPSIGPDGTIDWTGY